MLCYGYIPGPSRLYNIQYAVEEWETTKFRSGHSRTLSFSCLIQRGHFCKLIKTEMQIIFSFTIFLFFEEEKKAIIVPTYCKRKIPGKSCAFTCNAALNNVYVNFNKCLLTVEGPAMQCPALKWCISSVRFLWSLTEMWIVLCSCPCDEVRYPHVMK